MNSRLLTELDRMRRSAMNASKLVEGMTSEQFLADMRTQAAVAMFVINCGEAALRIMARHPDFVDEHSDWPWTSLRGMRNRIAHDYDTLDLALLWVTATESLPQLRGLIDLVLPWDRPSQSGS